MATIDKFIDDILKKEGGFQNSSSDNGNWTGGKTGKGKLVGTNLGVTAPVLAKWRGVKADSITEADIKSITPEEAKAIYEKKYYIDTKINLLPPEIQGNVLDMAINSGPSRAIKLLQKSAGVTADGVLGPKSIEAAAQVDNNSYVDARNNFYTSLVEKNPKKYSKFKDGWLNRSNSFRVDSTKLPPTGAGAGRGFVNPEFNAPAGYDTIPPNTPVQLPPAESRNYAAVRDVRNYSGMEPGIEEALKPQYATMDELLIDKDLMQNPLLFNDVDAERMWRVF